MLYAMLCDLLTERTVVLSQKNNTLTYLLTCAFHSSWCSDRIAGFGIALTKHCNLCSDLSFYAVLPFCCYGKQLDFMIKNTRFIQKTPDNKSKLTHSENTLTLRCIAKHKHCATHCKPETKEIGDSSNACVCLYRSVKLLTDDHKDFAAVQLQRYYIALRNLRYLIGRFFSKCVI